MICKALVSLKENLQFRSHTFVFFFITTNRTMESVRVLNKDDIPKIIPKIIYDMNYHFSHCISFQSKFSLNQNALPTRCHVKESFKLAEHRFWRFPAKRRTNCLQNSHDIKEDSDRGDQKIAEYDIEYDEIDSILHLKFKYSYSLKSCSATSLLWQYKYNIYLCIE